MHLKGLAGDPEVYNQAYTPWHQKWWISLEFVESSSGDDSIICRGNLRCKIQGRLG